LDILPNADVSTFCPFIAKARKNGMFFDNPLSRKESGSRRNGLSHILTRFEGEESREANDTCVSFVGSHDDADVCRLRRTGRRLRRERLEMFLNFDPTSRERSIR
jgi:hypothetical protein